MRTKMGLSEEAAKKIIKGVQNQRMIGSLQQAKSAGQLTLARLLDMRESGIDIESFVNEDMRLQMWSKEVRRPAPCAANRAFCLTCSRRHSLQGHRTQVQHRALHHACIDTASCVPQVTERLTDGTGDFDPEALLRKLPEDLALPEKKVAAQMRTLAKDRRHTTLVQVRRSAFCVRRHPASPACECSSMLQIDCLPNVGAAGSTPVMDMLRRS
jgi:hypothetical protein